MDLRSTSQPRLAKVGRRDRDQPVTPTYQEDRRSRLINQLSSSEFVGCDEQNEATSSLIQPGQALFDRLERAVVGLISVSWSSQCRLNASLEDELRLIIAAS